jgi:hypothetical protein
MMTADRQMKLLAFRRENYEKQASASNAVRFCRSFCRLLHLYMGDMQASAMRRKDAFILSIHLCRILRVGPLCNYETYWAQCSLRVIGQRWRQHGDGHVPLWPKDSIIATEEGSC